MQYQAKTRVIHKIWTWSVLTINHLIMWVYVLLGEFDSKKYEWVMLITVAFIAMGAIKISRDLNLRELSLVGIVADYIAVAFLSGMFLYVAFSVANLTGVIILCFVIALEIATVFIIANRARIDQWLVRRKQKK